MIWPWGYHFDEAKRPSKKAKGRLQHKRKPRKR